MCEGGSLRPQGGLNLGLQGLHTWSHQEERCAWRGAGCGEAEPKRVGRVCLGGGGEGDSEQIAVGWPGQKGGPGQRAVCAGVQREGR